MAELGRKVVSISTFEYVWSICTILHPANIMFPWDRICKVNQVLAHSMWDSGFTSLWHELSLTFQYTPSANGGGGGGVPSEKKRQQQSAWLIFKVCFSYIFTFYLFTFRFMNAVCSLHLSDTALGYRNLIVSDLSSIALTFENPIECPLTFPGTLITWSRSPAVPQSRSPAVPQSSN